MSEPMTTQELQKANAARWETLPPVHPAALLFPMMTDTEIDAVAADIKANGLRESAVFWIDNSEERNGARGPFPLFLLDGRNRVEALRRLGDADNIKPDHSFSLKSVPTVRVVYAIRQDVSLTLKVKWVVDGIAARTLATRELTLPVEVVAVSCACKLTSFKRPRNPTAGRLFFT